MPLRVACEPLLMVERWLWAAVAGAAGHGLLPPRVWEGPKCFLEVCACTAPPETVYWVF
jgi:hypothetical protein